MQIQSKCLKFKLQKYTFTGIYIIPLGKHHVKENSQNTIKNNIVFVVFFANFHIILSFLLKNVKKLVICCAF